MVNVGAKYQRNVDMPLCAALRLLLEHFHYQPQNMEL